MPGSDARRPRPMSTEGRKNGTAPHHIEDQIRAEARLARAAGLLDLTHDAIFVRDNGMT